ncbi:MAG: geranylgeranylglycerol-phosphate geranylgeranyltransferase [Bacteroidales bacterium]|nr:geranylgeranylglycerol-phosphate geranylgeranyltransferase [Bacteroidales bacterium]
MKTHFVGKLGGFARLIRWENLLMAALVFYFTRIWVVDFLLSLEKVVKPFNEWTFMWLVLNYLFVMAGGYAINDYYDVGMDEINRPHKKVLGNTFSIKTGWRVFVLCMGLGLTSSFVQAIVLKDKYLFILPLFVSALMWFYSTKFKREIFWGNFMIALLAFLNVFLVFLHYMTLFPTVKDIPTFTFKPLLYISLLYGVLSFWVTFIREIVKDVIDMEGDKAFNCNNFAIYLGQRKTTRLIFILGLVFLLFLVFFAWISFSFKSKYLFYYFSLLLIPFWLYLLIWMWKLQQKDDFIKMSFWLKVYMLSGILSLQVFSLSW